MEKYLVSSEFLDWKNPLVVKMAKELSQGLTKTKEITKEITKACFEYVRDEIKHSKDYQFKSGDMQSIRGA